MSVSIKIFGIYQNIILSNLISSSNKIKEKYENKQHRFSVQDLYLLYYENLFDTSDEVDKGINLLFLNYTKQHCFLLAEMMDYYFSDFNWQNVNNLESYNASYILEKSQLLGLIDWYIALSIPIDEQGQIYFKNKYFKEAQDITNKYYNDLSDIEFFKISGNSFIKLKEEIQNSKFDYYFYTYSF
ncbi:hypothetical protein KHA90_18520 [Flavobacterium psychroterrae]|uniref:Uncharacterized protein n=1 Tax=Flavobacterium psychroterrae TaxID=2133767 RepID=A0ABS5PGQ5_9FLAO|nr:hypothetical protein [Flavobacterium psychroterrae]MBS7233020.1 hypothetical protein [Flavobacterium psychroterrae]